jgi:hypothetical protein
MRLLVAQLAGVPFSDPINAGNRQFAVPRTQNGYNEIYALLLDAKSSGPTVAAQTTA